MSTADFLDAFDSRPDALFTIETYTDLPKGAANHHRRQPALNKTIFKGDQP